MEVEVFGIPYFTIFVDALDMSFLIFNVQIVTALANGNGNPLKLVSMSFKNFPVII